MAFIKTIALPISTDLVINTLIVLQLKQFCDKSLKEPHIYSLELLQQNQTDSTKLVIKGTSTHNTADNLENEQWLPLILMLNLVISQKQF